MSKSVTRLYRQFIPENYKLTIEVNREKMTFSGHVVIFGKKVGRPSKRLTFHQKNLKISDSVVTNHAKDKKSIKIDRANNHKSYDEVRLHSPDLIYPGQYEVELSFEGKITDNMTGLYPCYFEHEGKKKQIFATQFESHHAREVFPCIDEPEAKATFDLTLITEPEVEVLSNTKIKSQKTDNKKLITAFEKTPTMSSYLLAFTFGDIHGVSAKTKNNILVKSWASVAQDKKTLKYANDETVAVLDFFEDYFDTPFPLKKLDQIALPDFESGAMENWGLITYREIALLTDPDNRSVPTEQYVSMVIAHEISHQWFGNLVTMKWWDDLWLNESFASLMEHLVLDKLHPDWHQWEQYASVDIISSSNRDLYSDVQPVGTIVKHPDEISTLFDPAIVYAKGGRLLKMMREYIGDSAFREGLKNYFKVHAYKNTVRDDLWTEMSKSSGKDINALMTPWLEQSGMPVVKITKDTSGHTITQSRFLLDKNEDCKLWPIPLLSSEYEIDVLIKKSEHLTSAKIPLINPNGSGHYIVHYADDKNLAEIIKKVKNDPNLSESRINLLNDLMLLARRGDDSIVDALKLVQELDDEPRDAVWSIMGRVLGLSANLGEFNEIIEDGLRKLRYSLAHKNYQKLGWNDKETEDPNTKMLRATMIGLMLGSEDNLAVAKAKEIFKYAKTLEEIPSDRRGLVFSTVVKFADNEKVIDVLVDKYKTSVDPDLQSSISGSLSATRSEKTAKRLIAEALGKDGFVRMQDISRWYAYFMRNKHTRELAWEWLATSWDRLEKQFGGGKSMDYFVTLSAGPMQTKHWQDKFNKFFDPMLDNPSLTRNIKIAKSEINARIDWRNRELKHLQNFFKNT